MFIETETEIINQIPEDLKRKCVEIKNKIDVNERFIVLKNIVEKYNKDFLTKEDWLKELKDELYNKTHYETNKKKIKYSVREDGKVFFDEKIMNEVYFITRRKSDKNTDYLKKWTRISDLIDYDNVEKQNKYEVYKWILEDSGI